MSHSSETPTQPPRPVVVGLGNILLKDEGVGVHVIQHLARLSRTNALEYHLVDGGTCPDVFFHLPEEISKLIVVDAVKGGGKPGSIYRFSPDDLAFKRASYSTLHQLGLIEGLRMMKLLGKCPDRVILLGIEPKEIDWGLDISPELEEILQKVILLIEAEIAGQKMQDHGASARTSNQCP